MQGGARDADYAAAVLEGRVATTGSWAARRPQQRRRGHHAEEQPASGGRGAQHRSGGPGAGASGGGRHDGRGGSSSKKARHITKERQAQRQQHQRQKQERGGKLSAGTSAGSGDSKGAAAASTATGDAQPAYSQPGPRSTARIAHCSACDVFVPRRPGDWEVHVAGIRHRRQLLSLRLTGERNRLVLSAFESAPDSPEAAQRLVGGKAAHAFGLLPAHSRGGSSSSGSGRGAAGAGAAASVSSELLQAAHQLRTEALKQLLNLFGVGQIYNSAAGSFEERQLAACLQQAQQHLEQQQHQAGPPGSSGSRSIWTVSTGAELAALAHLALTGRLQAAELAVTLVPQPIDAPRSHHAGLAAALPLLLPALHGSSTITSLRLALPAPSGADAARLEQLWRQAWQHTLPALRSLLESSAPVRALHLGMPAGLQESTADYLPQLQAAAAAAPIAVRRHVLLALHPRAGRCSLLQLLPLAVVREVLDLAAPLQPCLVHVDVVPQGDELAAAAAGG